VNGSKTALVIMGTSLNRLDLGILFLTDVFLHANLTAQTLRVDYVIFFEFYDEKLMGSGLTVVHHSFCNFMVA